MQTQGPVEQRTRPRRRNRAALSCELCRMRKLKCNRQHPCQNCTARDEQQSCKFRGQQNDGSGTSEGIAPAGDKMRQRIDHLEGLVKTLTQERQPAPTPTKIAVPTPESHSPQTDPDMSGGAGKTVMDGMHSVYVSGSDWHVVLEEIRELKRAWDQDEDDDQSDHGIAPALSYAGDGSSLLFQHIKPMEGIEILSTLPSRAEVDQLISYFFDPAFPIHLPPILHKATFMREYNEHWENQSRTSFIWLGLLFSILGITMLAYHQHGEPSKYKGVSEPLFQLYRIRTSQCLLSGDMSKCLPYTVETLRFNATAELNRQEDNRRGLWIMSAVVVRAAINMGYHRDPSRIPGISVLQAEYRRRVWYSVNSMDDMASFLGGFPRMTSAISSDTAEPRNLHDWELSPDKPFLPPSRPLTEPTAATYLIIKGRLFRALGRVADFNNSAPTPGSYETLREVDRALQEAYQGLELMSTAAATAVDGGVRTTGASADNMFPYFGMLGMYHSGVCTLHRRFMAKARDDAQFGFSRERCIASALALVGMQQTLETGFYRYWQTRQMMTLAAMVLFLELELRRTAANGGGEDEDVAASPDSGMLLEALGRACARWSEAMGTCEEAGRVHRLLVKMLAGFRTDGPRPGADAGASGVPMVPIDERFGLLNPQLGVSNEAPTAEKSPFVLEFDLVCSLAHGTRRRRS
ncbi:hypothetical protein F5144DRAFT_570177 [Chaetomium tenue]|uniref:Uncharacterized protein n=1 Tax=Chaetomium tenue TaxID=1854479 RepID=A0ACB7PJT7_9PEZI|nr:hypothetical protein F5144DRAFT_570177 [Chaetomium globosum]